MIKLVDLLLEIQGKPKAIILAGVPGAGKGSILGDLEQAIIAGGTFSDANITQIGTGLHITRASGAFNISAPNGELLQVMSSSVNDVEDLPTQCRHGYVVKVKNSNTTEDDY